MNDIWLIGGRFLTRGFPFLPQMKDGDNFLEKDLPYIYQNFDIYCAIVLQCLLPQKRIETPLSCLRANFAEAMNERYKLPKFVVFFFDDKKTRRMQPECWNVL